MSRERLRRERSRFSLKFQLEPVASGGVRVELSKWEKKCTQARGLLSIHALTAITNVIHFEFTIKIERMKKKGIDENGKKCINCTVLTCRPPIVVTQKRDSILHCGTHFGASSSLALETKPIKQT